MQSHNPLVSPDDDPSVQDRSGWQDPGHGFEEQQDKPEKERLPDPFDQMQSDTSSAFQIHGGQSILSEAPHQNGARCVSKLALSERSWSFSPGRPVNCSLCCARGCEDADVCYLRCSCRKEETTAEGLLPRFHWGDVDHGQDFVDLL